MMSTLQDWVGAWKELKQWCLQKTSGKPSGIKEGGIYYDTDSKVPMYFDGTEEKPFATDVKVYAGVVSYPAPTFVDNGGGSITMAGCRARLYDNANFEGEVKEYEIPSKTLQLTDGLGQIVVIHHNAGTPEYRLVDEQDYTAYNLSNIVTVCRFWYAFGEVHSSSQDSLGLGLAEKQALRTGQTTYYERVGGVGLEPALTDRTLSISGASVWSGPVAIPVYSFLSSSDTFSYLWKNASGVWQKTVTPLIPNTYYNPAGSGLVTLTNSSKWTVLYVYRTIGDKKEAFVIIDTAEYNSETSAQDSKPRTDIPRIAASHSVLVGRILIKKDATTGTVESYWQQSFPASGGVSNHNDLAYIDGGDPAIPYYGHNTQLMQNRQTNAGSADGYALLGSDGKLPSNQLPSYVDDVLEYTNKAAFPTTGESGKIYVDLTTNLTWRWSGSSYIEISPSLALGETSATAYRGDRGNTAYDHSQINNANPHGTTASQISSTATGGVSATNVQSAIAELASYRDYWLKSNSGYFGGGELSENSYKNHYKGLSVAGTYEDNYRITFMAGDRAGVKSAGLYCDSLTAWAILVNNGKLTTGFTPPGSANDDQIPTTAWVKDVAAPINATLADNTASSTLPTTASGSLVSKIQQIRDYLKYLLSSVNSVSGDYVSKSVGTLQTIVSDLVTGKSHIGAWSGNPDYARVGHKDFNTISGFGFLQNDDGRVYIETPAAMPIVMRQDGVPKLTITDNGYTQIVTPPTSTDDNTAVTSAWVKDVAQPLDSTLTALADLSSGIPLLTSDSAATTINKATLVESLRANSVISGGGALTVSSDYQVRWSDRFIIIGNGRGPHFSTSGFFDIRVPSIGYVISGIGCPNRAVTTEGIKLDEWEALYYEIPVGMDYVSRDANFRVIHFGVDLEIPETWVMIALNNTDKGSVQFPNGVCLYAGESKTEEWQKQLNKIASSRDYWLKSNPGDFGGVELSENSYKNGYKGLSIAGTFPGNHRTTFMVGDKENAAYSGLYCDTLEKWAVLISGDELLTNFTPPTSADDEQIPTTAWVKDVAAPISHSHPSDTSKLAIGSGLSSGASVVVRQYNSGNTYSNNIIYLEY